MRRHALLLTAAALSAACVAVQTLPDPRGSLRPGQRLVVLVNAAPGPWIVSAADSKAMAAAKISPLGVFAQDLQDERTLAVSKDLQQYLPRPPYAALVQESLLASLRVALSSAGALTAAQAGVAPAQLAEWNKAKDQLDWRRRYYAPHPDSPAPRDYARLLILDDALVLDVNVSYGTRGVEGEEDRIVPMVSAAARVYRGDTSRLIWEHEEFVTDQSSSFTLVEFKIQPQELAGRLRVLAPQTGAAVAASFLKAFQVAAPAPAAAPAPSSGGLVPMSEFEAPASTAPAVPPEEAPAPAPSDGAPAPRPPAAEPPPGTVPR